MGFSYYPGSGKARLRRRMQGSLWWYTLIIVLQKWRLALDEVSSLVMSLRITSTPNGIADLLKANMTGSGVKTIVVDLSPAFSRWLSRRLWDNDAGATKLRERLQGQGAGYGLILGDAITGFGVNTLWILPWSARGWMRKPVERETHGKRCRTFLLASFAQHAPKVVDRATSGVLVEGAPDGRACIAVGWFGVWRGMPERIENPVYWRLNRWG